MATTSYLLPVSCITTCVYHRNNPGLVGKYPETNKEEMHSETTNEIVLIIIIFIIPRAFYEYAFLRSYSV